jgi:serine/threonine protein kinase
MTWGDVMETPPGGSGAAAATAPAPAPSLSPVSPTQSLGVTLGVYRLVQRLGEGGMGVVHLGLDPHGRAVAIKVLRAHIAYDPDARARLNREVATLSRVRHPLVAEVMDADVDGDQPFVVTRYVPGLTLDAEVRERGPMPPALLVQLGRGLSSALEAIHAAGVVHRDLKPANVLMLDGDPVVIDFGIAHVADDVRLTMTGLVMGTPGYLSPELVNGSPVTAATDWWGFAATLAFAASGQPPFGRGPADVVIDRVRRGDPDLTGVDARLQPLLRAALSPDPARRPGAPEVLDALERFALGGSATVPVSPAGTRVLAEPTGLVVTPPTRPYAAEPVAPQSFSPPAPPSVAAAPAPVPPPPPQSDDPLAIFRPPAADQQPPPPPKPRRTGTLLAVLVALVGAGSCWPTVTALVAAALIVLARTADRSVAAAGRRRQERGPSRGDPFVAVVSVPWHLVRAAAASVTGLLLPALLGVSAAFCAGAASGSVSLTAAGASTVAASQVAAAVGLLVALLVAWWGPGGGSVRRGSRGLVRGVVRGDAVTAAVIVLCLAGGCAAAYLAYSRGHPTFAPLHSLPFGITVR